MNLFEDWYITFFNIPETEYKETFIKENGGQYYYYHVLIMHRAFCAGQVLRGGLNNEQ